MSEFVKPVQKIVNLRDAFSDLFGKDLLKDLHDNEDICPVCHGTGLRIENNPYGLSDDPQKWPMFPYKHQSLSFCHNCYNGVVRFCPDCGKQLPRGRMVCGCEAVEKRRRAEEARKEREQLEKAEKHSPNALGTTFVCACSGYFSHNEGYFFDWDSFFEDWHENYEEGIIRPEYVWGTEVIEMAFDAGSIVESACEDLYEDAYSDIGDKPIAEMQEYLDSWKRKYGREAYMETHKHAIRIPWEEDTCEV